MPFNSRGLSAAKPPEGTHHTHAPRSGAVLHASPPTPNPEASKTLTPSLPHTPHHLTTLRRKAASVCCQTRQRLVQSPQSTIAPAGASESHAQPITIFRGSVRRSFRYQAAHQCDRVNGAHQTARASAEPEVRGTNAGSLYTRCDATRRQRLDQRHHAPAT